MEDDGMRLSPEQLAAMAELEAREAERRELDRQIEKALARSPLPNVPADFAARVAARVPAQRTMPVHATATARAPMYARRAMILGLLVLLAALIGSAPRLAGGSGLATAAQWIFCAEAVLIAMFLGPWRSAWRPNS